MKANDHSQQNERVQALEMKLKNQVEKQDKDIKMINWNFQRYDGRIGGKGLLSPELQMKHRSKDIGKIM